MNDLSAEWIVGLGLLVLVLALWWERWFPGVTDSQPEIAPPEDAGNHPPYLQHDPPP